MTCCPLIVNIKDSIDFSIANRSQFVTGWISALDYPPPFTFTNSRSLYRSFWRSEPCAVGEKQQRTPVRSREGRKRLGSVTELPVTWSLKRPKSLRLTTSPSRRWRKRVSFSSQSMPRTSLRLKLELFWISRAISFISNVVPLMVQGQ